MPETSYRNYVPAIADDLAPPPASQPEIPSIRASVSAEQAWFVLICAPIWTG